MVEPDTIKEHSNNSKDEGENLDFLSTKSIEERKMIPSPPPLFFAGRGLCLMVYPVGNNITDDDTV